MCCEKLKHWAKQRRTEKELKFGSVREQGL